MVCILRFDDSLLRTIESSKTLNIHSLEASPALEAGSGSCGQGPEDLLSFFFIVAPCILTTLKFLSPTNALLFYTYRMLKYTVKISHDCSYCIF